MSSVTGWPDLCRVQLQIQMETDEAGETSGTSNGGRNLSFSSSRSGHFSSLSSCYDNSPKKSAHPKRKGVNNRAKISALWSSWHVLGHHRPLGGQAAANVLWGDKQYLKQHLNAENAAQKLPSASDTEPVNTDDNIIGQCVSRRGTVPYWWNDCKANPHQDLTDCMAEISK